MIRKFLAVCLLIFLNLHLTKSECDYVKANIIPNIMRRQPRNELQVSYPGFTIPCGYTLLPFQVATVPEISYKLNDDSYYTLMILDPDAPFPAYPNAADLLHMLVVNIPGSNVDKGQVIVDYLPPNPPPTSRPHRYIFVLYLQRSFIDNTSSIIVIGRTNFNTHIWKDKLKLKTIDAGYFFYVQPL